MGLGDVKMMSRRRRVPMPHPRGRCLTVLGRFVTGKRDWYRFDRCFEEGPRLRASHSTFLGAGALRFFSLARPPYALVSSTSFDGEVNHGSSNHSRSCVARLRIFLAAHRCIICSSDRWRRGHGHCYPPLYARQRTDEEGDLGPIKPDRNNAAAFMTASMQAVITKLREQEKRVRGSAPRGTRACAADRAAERSRYAQYARRPAAAQCRGTGD